MNREEARFILTSLAAVLGIASGVITLGVVVRRRLRNRFARGGYLMATAALMGGIVFWGMPPRAGRMKTTGVNPSGESTDHGSPMRLSTYRGRPLVLGNKTRPIRLAAGAGANRLVTISEVAELEVWDLRTATRVHRLDASPESVEAVVATPDGRVLVTGGAEGQLTTWETETGRLLTRAQSDSEIVGLAISPDGRLVASSHWDGAIRLWNREQLAPVGVLGGGPSDHVTRLAFSPDSQWLTAAGLVGHLHYRLVTAGPPARDLGPVVGPREAVTCLVHPEPQQLICGTASGTILVIDPRAARIARTYRIPQEEITAVGVSSCNGLLAAAGAGGAVRVWHRTNDEELLRATTAGYVSTVLFEPGAGELVTVERAGTVTRWGLK